LGPGRAFAIPVSFPPGPPWTAAAAVTVAATPTPVATPVAPSIARLALGVVGGQLRHPRRQLDRHQGDLAHRVDVGDLDLERIALVDHVLHPSQPDVAAQLRDVDEAVLGRREGHEGPEGSRLDHDAVEALADLGHPGVGQLLDAAAGLVGRATLLGADPHRPVVLDVDLDAGGGDDLVDPLALRADDLADLVDGDREGHDAGSGRGELG